MLGKDTERLVERASEIASFHMSPLRIAEERLNFLSKYFSLEEVEIPGFIVEEWGCEAVALGRRVPCLPSGLGSATQFVIADYAEFSNAGTLIFDGYVLPRTKRVLLTPAMSIPRDYKDLVMRAIKEGEFYARTWGRARGAKAYMRKGSETCLVTYYDALWYGFAHSATALAALTLWDSENTLIFVPRFSRWEDLLVMCGTTILLDGIGVSGRGLGSEDLYLTVGGETKYKGSPFDTPDKLKDEIVRRHLKLLSSLIKRD